MKFWLNVTFCILFRISGDYPSDSTIAAKPFVLRDFVVGTSNAIFAHVHTDGTNVKVRWTGVDINQWQASNRKDITIIATKCSRCKVFPIISLSKLIDVNFMGVIYLSGYTQGPWRSCPCFVSSSVWVSFNRFFLFILQSEQVP